MYIVNFPPQSNSSNFYQDWLLVADDDETGLTDSEVIVYVQCWSRTSRGTGDQMPIGPQWPYLYGGSYFATPVFAAATNDGTGKLTLYDGTLSLNIPASTMMILAPGYYEMYFTISTIDGTVIQQLASGTFPLQTGGMWNTPTTV